MAERALETVVEVVAERVAGELRRRPDPRGADAGADVPRAGRDRRAQRAPPGAPQPDGAKAVGERFRIGDRLIQTRNSHELGLMNGSIVFLRSDDRDDEQIVVDTDEGGTLTMPYSETATLKLAYAISVSKAQGCEVPVVVAVCHRSHTRMLTRPLLYRDHPGAARLRPGRRLGGAGPGGRPRRGQRSPLRPRRPPGPGIATLTCRPSACDRLAP